MEISVSLIRTLPCCHKFISAYTGQVRKKTCVFIVFCMLGCLTGYTPPHGSGAGEPPQGGSYRVLYRKSCANLGLGGFLVKVG